MKLSEYAQLAEVVSGVAVVITLLILVFEIRNNTSAIESSTYDSLVADIADWRLTVAVNPSLIENIYLTDADPGEITGARIDERAFMWTSLFHIYERAYIQWQAGNLNDEAWERFERQICLDRGPGFRAGMGPIIEDAMLKSFYEFYSACVE